MKQIPLNHAPSFVNMREVIEYVASHHGEKIAYSYRQNPRDKEVQEISFIQLASDARALATAAVQNGFAGKKIALIGTLSYERNFLLNTACDKGGFLFGKLIVGIVVGVIVEEMPGVMELNEIFVHTHFGKPVYNVCDYLVVNASLKAHTSVMIGGSVVIGKG